MSKEEKARISKIVDVVLRKLDRAKDLIRDIEHYVDKINDVLEEEEDEG